MRLEFFYLYSDGDENQEPTVYPSFAFGKKTVLWTVLREAREKRVPEDGPEKHKKLQTSCLEFFYSHPDGDENQEPTVYPSFAFGKKTA